MLKISRYAPFGDDDAELQKLSMDLGCSPFQILFRQPPAQRPDLFGDLRPVAPRTGLPAPIRLKPRAMPADDCVGFHNDQDVGPAGPKAAEGRPEVSVQPIQTGTGPFPLKNCDLLALSEDY